METIDTKAPSDVVFKKFVLDYKENIFGVLSRATKFEDIARGRKGAVLVDCEKDLVPVVRTTTRYEKPAQKFLGVHQDIVDKIKTVSKIDNLRFNNALIELYDTKYCTMGYHSDQAQDLDQKSYICVFSCYDTSKPRDVRTLRIQDKVTEKETDILMEHNSIVLWSLSVNSKYLHKIILEENSRRDTWLGITFRLSKTLIQFIDRIPYFYPTKIKLRLADKYEEKEFYRYRSKENKSLKYVYPELDYSISKSDLMLVE